MKRRSSRDGLRLKLTVPGDQRAAENVILQVRALARRYGLEVAAAETVRSGKAATTGGRARGERRVSPGTRREPRRAPAR